jgi:hypothetical protein
MKAAHHLGDLEGDGKVTVPKGCSVDPLHQGPVVAYIAFGDAATPGPCCWAWTVGGMRLNLPTT